MPAEELVHALIVGAVLAQLRQRRSLTQAVFAHQTGVTQPTLSRVERGESHPTPLELSKMAQVLGSSSVELTATIEAAHKRLAGSVRVLMNSDLPQWSEVISMAGRRGIAALCSFSVSATLSGPSPKRSRKKRGLHGA